MVGGTTRFYHEPTFDRVIHKHQEKTPERTKQIINLIKSRGEMYMSQIGKILGISTSAVRMAIENAITREGSRLYEDYEHGQVVVGWLD